MSNYSIEGYLVALRMRSARTLLVEGCTDLKVLSRVMLEFSEESSSRWVIDPVEIVSDKDRLVGGNRDRVKYIVSHCEQHGVSILGLVDREFDWFEVDTSAVVDPVGCEHQEGNLWYTRGHSIENYLLSTAGIAAYLRTYFPDVVILGVLTQLEAVFESIVRQLAALSEAARRCGVLSRMEGIFEVESWTITSRGPGLDVRHVSGSLGGRGTEQSVRARLLEQVRDFKPAFEATEFATAQDFAHGHILWEGVWTAIAGVALGLGVSPVIAESIGRGHRDTKIRHLSDRLATTSPILESLCCQLTIGPGGES